MKEREEIRKRSARIRSKWRVGVKTSDGRWRYTIYGNLIVAHNAMLEELKNDDINQATIRMEADSYENQD